MGEWIANSGEAAFEELGEAFVFGFFGVGFEEVESKDGILDGEDLVHQGGTVAFEAGEVADALGEAFGGFEDGVEVVVLEEFGATVFGDFGMDGSPAEFELDGFEPSFCLVERGGHLHHSEFPVLAEIEDPQVTGCVELVAMVFELAGVADEATGGEGGLDEVDDPVGAAVLPLAVGKGPVETPPFGGLAGVIFQTPVVQGAGDLIAIPALFEQSRDGLDLTFGEWRDGAHGR